VNKKATFLKAQQMAGGVGWRKNPLHSHFNARNRSLFDREECVFL